jgi:hypothetical protein
MEAPATINATFAQAEMIYPIPMAEGTLDERDLIPPATGSAGPIPHPAYCTPQCYAKGKLKLSRSCQCKGCRGDAHGRGKKYAFDHGYLRDSPIGSRKPPPGIGWLFPEEPPTPIEEADQP